MTIFRKYRKHAAVLLLATIFLASGYRNVSAAIPVIDSQNISQQLKTYLESVKVVTNTAQQITLQAKELLALPENILNGYKSAVSSQISRVQGIFRDGIGGIFNGAASIKTQWEKDLPKIIGSDVDTTIAGERRARDTMLESQYQDHKKMVSALAEVTKEIDECNKRLLDLAEKNKTVEGNKQAQQIANQIALEQNNLQSLQLRLKAMEIAQNAKASQAKVVEAQNARTTEEAYVNANKAATDKMKDEVAQKDLKFGCGW